LGAKAIFYFTINRKNCSFYCFESVLSVASCQSPIELISFLPQRNLACAPSIVLFYFIYSVSRMTMGQDKKNNMLRKQSKHLPGGEGKNFGRGWVQPAKYYA